MLSLLLLAAGNTARGDATLKLPRTGQTRSFIANDDAAIGRGVAWPSPRFQDNGDGTLTDRLTGLMWLKDGGCLGSGTWSEGLNAVADFNQHGTAAMSCQGYNPGIQHYSDWRVPNVNEYKWLFNAGYASQSMWLMSQGFTGVSNLTYYWASTTHGSGADYTYAIDLINGGLIFGYPKSTPNNVMAVRGGTTGAPHPDDPVNVPATGQTTVYDTNQPPRDDGALQYGRTLPTASERFKDLGNGIIHDQFTNLYWLTSANCIKDKYGSFDQDGTAGDGQVSWASAFNFVSGMNDGTYAGCNGGMTSWRVPNKRELGSLITHGQFDPALLPGVFNNIQGAGYWTSTTYQLDWNKAWVIHLMCGSEEVANKGTEPRYLWPVADHVPPPTPPKTQGQSANNGEKGDPVSTATGELYFSVTDLYLGGPLPLWFGRTYASFLKVGAGVESALGVNWMHNFDLKVAADTTVAEVTYIRGKRITFEKRGGAWEVKRPAPIAYQLIKAGGGWKMLDPMSSLSYTFDSSGLLKAVADRNSNILELIYSGSRLDRVNDGLGRSLIFSYSADELVGVQDHSGRSIDFEHDNGKLMAFTDGRGNRTAYAYQDKRHRPALLNGATRPEGNTPFSQTYDAMGRVIAQQDASANQTNLSYDTPTTGMTTISDPLARTVVHTHDGLNLTGHLDQSGTPLTLAHDVSGRRNKSTDRTGEVTSASYHEATGKLAAWTDTLGNRTAFTYSPQFQDGFTHHDLTRVDYPDGTFIAMTYDGRGNRLTLIDRKGSLWQYTYNSRGQVLTTTTPLGGVTTYAYNGDGTRKSRLDHAGNLTQYTYDTLGRLTRATYADGSHRGYGYDGNDNLLTITNELGKTTALAYDRNNNLVKRTDPLGREVHREYDGNDRLFAVVGPLGKRTAYAYNNLGQLASVTGPAGNIKRYGYDSRGWLATVTDGPGNVTRLTRDAEGQLTAITDPLGQTHSYTLDELGWTTERRTPSGAVHRYSYNETGRLTAYTDPLSRQTTLTRDGRGLLSAISLPGGLAASYARNALGQITAVTDPNGQAWSRGYDDLGRMTSRTDPLSRKVLYGYDSRGRRNKVTFPAGTLDVSYDEAGHIVQKKYSDGTVLDFTYDDKGRLTAASNLTLAYDARDGIIGSNGITLTRDDAGRIASVTLHEGKTVTYAYDGRGLVTEVRDWVGGVTALSHDEAGQLTKLTRPNGVVTTYTHDGDGRLTAIREQGATVLAATVLLRDAAGAITAAERDMPRTADPQPGTLTLTHDGASQVQGYTYDQLGRLTSDGSHSCSWNLAGRLTTYQAGGATITFSHDGLGRRTGRSEGGVAREYVWNYAFDLPAISLIRQGGADRHYYVHLPDGRLLHSITATGRERRFYHYDEMGNTRFLTGNNSLVTDSYGSGPFGFHASRSGTTENPFVFQGAFGVMAEGDTGLYQMHLRIYDSRTARFLSRDPVRSLRPDQVNPYLYARNNPLSYLDPLGTAPGGFTNPGFFYGEALGSEDQRVEQSFLKDKLRVKNPNTSVSVNRPLTRHIPNGTLRADQSEAAQTKPLNTHDGSVIYSGSGGQSFYIPYLLETTGVGGGAYNGDVFLMNTTGTDIDVDVYLFDLAGNALLASPEPATLTAGATTIVSVESLLGTISGAAVVNTMVTSTDIDFSGGNIAAFAAITGFLPGGGTAGYTIGTLWKAG